MSKSSSSAAPPSTGAATKGGNPVVGNAAQGTSGDPKKRPPKGHRQKGAGTVVVSKGEIKKDGLEIKEWQQTPKQILLNFCKSEKRPPPRYVSASGAPIGKFLVRVILPDPKDQRDKDMTFVPKDTSFDSQIEAEHAVALLALHKVDGTRSYELKLPEPYRSAWLNLTGRAAASSATEKSEPDPFVCETCGKGFAKIHGLEHHVKTAHPKPKKDLSSLGEEAGKQNKKADLNDAKEASPAPSPSPPPPATAMITSKSANGMKKDSTTLLQLKAHSKFSTEHERREFNERIRVEKEREQKHRMMEENADEDYVFMSEENRVEVEAIVREAVSRRKSGSQSHCEHDLSEIGKTVVEALVKRMGFNRADARTGVMNGGDSIEGALDWLLVHLDEDRLPEGFDPRGMQLDVKLAQTLPTSKASESRSQLVSFPSLSASDEDIIKWFESVLQVSPVPDTTTTARSPGAEQHEEWRGEWEVLESILGTEDARVVDNGRGLVRYVLSIGEKATLEILLAPTSYPHTSSPVCWLRVPRASNEDAAKAARALTTKARTDFKGESCAYALWDYVRQMGASALLKSEEELSSPVDPAENEKHAEEEEEGKIKDRAVNGHGQRRMKSNNRGTLVSESERKKQSEELSRRVPMWRSLRSKRNPLPAHSFRNSILSAVDSSRVVIVTGETGCGKSTQVPQFFLEDAAEKGEGGWASVVVTQPRRLAAVSLAQRVADELGEELGGVVGYRVQLESRAHPLKTRLEFVTTGVLLRRMQGENAISTVSHVVVDEVHERSLDSDLLLALLKKSLEANPKLKVVLMSATVNARTFSEYFLPLRVPILEIPGRTFPVRDFFLEDVMDCAQLRFWTERARASVAKSSKTDNEGILVAQRLERDALEDPRFVASCVMQCHLDIGSSDGSILVFTSGVAEITAIIRACEATTGDQLYLLPLHGALTGADQRRVFDRAPKGRRKVVVSTNVAETSVTIEDVVCVIDTARVKETRFDPATKMSALVDTIVSAASAKQRRGRAGRVREGVCWKLLSKSRALEPNTLAEVHRVPLEQCVLHVASMDLAPTDFLSRLVEPPATSSVAAAVRSLVEIGAMDDIKAQLLTPLGRHLARLPLDARLGKMLIFGSLLGVPEGSATMAACLSRRTPFLTPPLDKREEAKAAKKALCMDGVAAGAQSDHLVLVAAFDAWNALRIDRERRAFCSQHFLSDEGMREISKLRAEFLNALDNGGFEASDESELAFQSRMVGAELRRRRLLKASLCAGLYPSIVRVRRPEKRFVETMGGALEAETTARELAFEALHGEERPQRVYIHPSSINFDAGAFNSSWLVYSELVQTTKPFARDCTAVAPYGLLLFGGALTVRHEEGVVMARPGVRFKMSPRVCVLVKELRNLLDKHLERKLARPGEDLDDTRALEACKRLIVGNGFY